MSRSSHSELAKTISGTTTTWRPVGEFGSIFSAVEGVFSVLSLKRGKYFRKGSCFQDAMVMVIKTPSKFSHAVGAIVFLLYCFEVLCCLDRSLNYVNGEPHER